MANAICPDKKNYQVSKITAIVDIKKNAKLFKASNYVPDVHVKFKNLYKNQNF